MASEDRILSVNRMADSLIEAGHTGMPNHDAILEHHVITIPVNKWLTIYKWMMNHIVQLIVTPNV